MATSKELAVNLVLTADSQGLQAEIAKITRAFQQMGTSAGGGGGKGVFDAHTQSAETFQQSLRGLIGRFSALWAVVQSSKGIAQVLNFGIEFNSQMENARLGIGALITAQATLADSTGKVLGGQEALNAAMQLGDDQITKLRISGLQTAATTEQLVSAFQDAVGGGLRAGMSLDQIRILTVQTVQAAGAMGVPMNQLNQEIRSILDGTIDRNSRVAIRLGITNADVAKWKDAGTLFENLNKRMEGFTVAGKESMKNWTTILSNIKEAGQIFTGAAFKAPMADVKNALNGVMETLVNVNTAQLSDRVQPLLKMLQDLGRLFGDFVVSAVNAVTNALLNMGLWWERNRAAITEVIASFKVFMGDALSFVGSVAVGIIKFLAESFLWWTKLPEAIKTVHIAMVAFFVALKVGASTAASTLIPQLVAGLTRMVAVVRALATAYALGGAQGFAIALGMLVNPVTWVVAGLAALTGGIYYFITAGERAAKSARDLARASQEATQALVAMGSGFADIDKSVKTAKVGTAAHAEAMKEKEQAVKRLIEQFPAYEETIKKDIANGLTLLDVKKNLLVAELALAKVRTAEAKTAEDAAFQKLKKDTGGIMSAPGAGLLNVMYEKRRDSDMAALKAAGDTLKLRQQDVAAIEDGIKALTKQTTIIPNKPSDAKGQAAAEKARKADAQALLQLQDAQIDGLPKITAEQREQIELKRLELDINKKLEALRKGGATAAVREKVSKGYDAEYERRYNEIKERYAADLLAAEKEWQEISEEQEGDSLERKLTTLKNNVHKWAEELRNRGLIISEADEKAVLSERIWREEIAQEMRDIKKLEGALTDLGQARGRALSIDEQLSALDQLAKKMGIATRAVTTLENTLRSKKVATAGWSAGIRKYVEDVKTSFEDMSTAAHRIMSGIENAIANGIQGMLTGSMSLAEGMKAIWNGVLSTFANFVAEMIAKQVMMAVADSTLTKTKVANDVVKTVSSGTAATAEVYEAHAGIPWVGVALAAAMVATMLMGMSDAGRQSEQIAGRIPGAAEGAWFGRPTLTMIGEGRHPELVIPDVSFENYSKNLADGILAQTGSRRESSGSPVNVHLHNPTILDSSNRGMEKLGNMVLSGIQVAGRRRGQVIQPGFVFGGV